MVYKYTFVSSYLGPATRIEDEDSVFKLNSAFPLLAKPLLRLPFPGAK